MIRFDGAGKRHPDGTIAVEGLDLTVPEGRTTVLVGPSGCGKTTILRMVNRMIEPTSGRVLLDGTDVAQLEAAKLRRGIGYVIQQAGLFPHRKVLDNIATVPYLLGWDRKRARARAMELLELVGLAPETAKRYPFQLSGGQQQRVGVARALAADPPLLLMDEPFSAVDPVVRAGLQEELLRLQGELNKTVLFVTHDIEEAVRLGDQIVVLREHGRIGQVADPATLLSAPADEQVAAFLGRDRGLRGLALRPAAGIALLPPAGPYEGWTLTVDEQGRPSGWQRSESGETIRHVAVFHPGADTLRTALDSAVLSPARAAVAVDADGRVLGLAPRAAVLDALDAAGPQAAALATTATTSTTAATGTAASPATALTKTTATAEAAESAGIPADQAAGSGAGHGR
ncbi:ATP-binding cassette domain-containing protein [Kitasatospora sp. NBC_01287]|uniref:ABC transporter ATP-binding protein n=1 Tax=Kitasatospora sp. NBC_01287 TaxID=2903573 RepID=UPI002259D062|nr:ATP-binding cassette domain-containing protein [Kitasatospora sp. NBC_01287]MCX4745444.1 ATP-binding cassette domain-containing protein [Kitasatospora sp. NBC_01287]